MSRQSRLVATAVCLLLWPMAACTQPWEFPSGEDFTSDQFDLLFTLKAPNLWPAEARVQVAVCMRDEANFYYADFGSGEVFLGCCTGGKRSRLSAPVALTERESEEGFILYEIAIQRRARLLQLVCDGRRLCTAYDGRLAAGKVAIVATGRLEVQELTPQPIGEIYLDDDFAREPDESGEWEVLSGEWKSSGESIKRAKPNLSTNPFSYHVKAEGKALATTGYDFWSGYRLRAAVKPAAEGAVGLALYLSNPSNYYLLRWSRGAAAGSEPTGRLQLVKVQASSWSLLAEQLDCPYRIDQWHDLAVTAADGRLEAYVDGRLTLAARDSTFVRGRVGLFAEDCDSAYFDDVGVRSYDCFSEDFSSADVIQGRCAAVVGAWKVRSQHLYGAVAAPAGRAYMVTGERTWGDYILNAMTKLKDAKRVGLVFCYRDPANHYLVRWGPTDDSQGLRELVCVADAKERVLATARFSCNPARRSATNFPSSLTCALTSI